MPFALNQVKYGLHQARFNQAFFSTENVIPIAKSSIFQSFYDGCKKLVEPLDTQPEEQQAQPDLKSPMVRAFEMFQSGAIGAAWPDESIYAQFEAAILKGYEDNHSVKPGTLACDVFQMAKALYFLGRFGLFRAMEATEQENKMNVDSLIEQLKTDKDQYKQFSTSLGFDPKKLFSKESVEKIKEVLLKGIKDSVLNAIKIPEAALNAVKSVVKGVNDTNAWKKSLLQRINIHKETILSLEDGASLKLNKDRKSVV